MDEVVAATDSMKGRSVKVDDLFTIDTAGLSDASPPRVIRLNDGDQFDLRIEPVRKRINDAELRMLGYNASIPGPTLHVDQGSEITVQVTNSSFDSMFKLTNRSTQPAIASGARMKIAGVRNGRWRPGSLLRRIMTPSDTAAKANNVPAFE